MIRILTSYRDSKLSILDGSPLLWSISWQGTLLWVTMRNMIRRSGLQWLFSTRSCLCPIPCSSLVGSCKCRIKCRYFGMGRDEGTICSLLYRGICELQFRFCLGLDFQHGLCRTLGLFTIWLEGWTIGRLGLIWMLHARQSSGQIFYWSIISTLLISQTIVFLSPGI